MPKEILLKFESEEDYNEFIKTVVTPTAQEGGIEYDSQNEIITVKQLKTD
jgi:hypothetical protein